MNKIIVAVLAAGVLAGGAYMWHFQYDQDVVAASSLGAAKSVSAPTLSRPSPETSVDDRTPKIEGEPAAPAWMRPSSSSAPEREKPVALSSIEEKDRVRLAKLQVAVERAQVLRSKPNVTPEEAMRVLKEIELANGSPNLNGIRLDVLRENLDVASQMKSLSDEVQGLQLAVEAKKPGAMEAMQGKVKAIEALQGRLKTDFYARPQAATSPAVP